MRLPVACCLVVCGAVSVSPAEEPKKPANTADDLKQFEGSWKVVAFETGLRKVEPDEVAGLRWIFKGGEVQVKDRGQTAGVRSSVKIDASKTPKEIDLVDLEGMAKGKTIQGIYKLEGDRLTVCMRALFGAEKGRPRDFAVGKEEDLVLITLSRIRD